MTNDLELAIQMFRNQAARYRRYERYYKGEHDLSFATEKFQSAFGSMFREFAMNLCPTIVDAVENKLKVMYSSVGITRDPVDISWTNRKSDQTWSP